MLIDCHNHSEFSPDGNYPVSDMVKAAIQKGIEVFAISDHCEVDRYEENRHKITVKNSFEYTKKEQENSQLKLLCSIELGQPNYDFKKADEIISSYDFDMVIGSLHNLKCGDDFYFVDYLNMSNTEIEEMLLKYYSELFEITQWAKFDTLAHITYPYRYIYNVRKTLDGINLTKFDDIVNEIFTMLVQKEKGFELNLASLKNGAYDADLHRKYLKMFQDCGGKYITIGSDAHFTKDVDRGIQFGYSLLKEIGFNKVTYYEKRKPVMVSI